MTEAELVKIREALEKETLAEAQRAVEGVLLELGYYRAEPHKNVPRQLTNAELAHLAICQ